MPQESVNQRIAELVKHFCNGNKSAFAKAVGVTSQGIGEIIGGRQSAPSFAALQKIALAYPSISLNWLVLGEGPMFELIDEDLAHKYERYADEVESHAGKLYELGLISKEDYAPGTSDLEGLRHQEEIARVELTAVIEDERKYERWKQQNRENTNAAQLDFEQASDSRLQRTRKLAEKAYIDAIRVRMRAERMMFGFNTDSSTAIYLLGDESKSDSLYGGRLSTRLSISDEAAERLVKEGKIRATYIDGEGYRITEQAVRIFLGEF